MNPCQPATSCVRDQHAITTPARHMWETGTLNWNQFMLQWLSVSLNSLNSVKVMLHLGKTPIPTKRMHSSRMRTDHSRGHLVGGGVWSLWGCLLTCEGVCLPVGVSAYRWWWGCLITCGGVCIDNPLGRHPHPKTDTPLGRSLQADNPPDRYPHLQADTPLGRRPPPPPPRRHSLDKHLLRQTTRWADTPSIPHPSIPTPPPPPPRQRRTLLEGNVFKGVCHSFWFPSFMSFQRGRAIWG